MRTLKITITQKEDTHSLFAWNDTRLLFQFEPRGLDDDIGTGQWFFWPKGDFNPVKKKGDFPMEYFLNLCKAMDFIFGENDEMPEEVKIINGLNYLK